MRKVKSSSELKKEKLNLLNSHVEFLDGLVNEFLDLMNIQVLNVSNDKIEFIVIFKNNYDNKLQFSSLLCNNNSQDIYTAIEDYLYEQEKKEYI